MKLQRDTFTLAQITAVAVMAIAGAAAAQPQAEADDSEASFEARYGSLLTHNLFERDRRPPRRDEQRPPTSRPAPPPSPPPEKDYRLVGIVFEDGQFRAYFENLRTHRIERVAPGDPIATGIIGEVYIDAVSYLADGQIVWVDFGDDLTGEGAPVPARPSRSSSPDSNSESQQSILERLRQRRQAAQNRGGDDPPPPEAGPEFDEPLPDEEADGGESDEEDEEANQDDPEPEDPTGDGGAR